MHIVSAFLYTGLRCLVVNYKAFFNENIMYLDGDKTALIARLLEQAKAAGAITLCQVQDLKGADAAGAAGADVWTNGRLLGHVEALPTTVVDPTGAGDVFAAAFLIRFSETTDPIESATFASIAAGMSVSARGVQAIPDKKAIESLRANL